MIPKDVPESHKDPLRSQKASKDLKESHKNPQESQKDPSRSQKASKDHKDPSRCQKYFRDLTESRKNPQESHKDPSRSQKASKDLKRSRENPITKQMAKQEGSRRQVALGRRPATVAPPGGPQFQSGSHLLFQGGGTADAGVTLRHRRLSLEFNCQIWRPFFSLVGRRLQFNGRLFDDFISFPIEFHFPFFSDGALNSIEIRSNLPPFFLIGRLAAPFQSSSIGRFHFTANRIDRLRFALLFFDDSFRTRLDSNRGDFGALDADWSSARTL